MSPEAAPPDACDCHVHIVGLCDQFPQIPTRSYTARTAPLASLRVQAEPLGVRRFVVVQPSFYGQDNSCLLETLDSLAGNGRGVAAIHFDGVSDRLLEEYGRRGVCGVRVNLYSKSLGASDRRLEQRLQATIERLPPAGWHVEIIAALPVILAAESSIAHASVPIVIDHYGLPGAAGPESGPGRRFLALVALPHVWVKLTAPYRVASDPLATEPPGNWLSALLQTAPERCVWGSDWPHTPAEREQLGAEQPACYRELGYGRLLGDFLAAISDPTLRLATLRDNPQRLYGFSG